MNEKWICSCGAECEGKFCTQCGSPRPVATPDKGNEKGNEKASEKWACSCGAENEGKFCNQCGSPKPAATPDKGSEKVSPRPAEAAPVAAPVPAQPKKKSKKPLLIIIVVAAAVVVIAAAALLYFFVFSKNYEVNQFTASGQEEVMERFFLLTDSERDISVQYPDYLEASVQDNGSYIYGNGNNAGCYIRISRYSGKESPESYFKSFQKMLEEQYSDLTFSSINEVQVEDKTLYMIMVDLPDLGPFQQYLELYPDYYITYSSVGYENEGGVNTELYYAISTLRPDAEAYIAP